MLANQYNHFTRRFFRPPFLCSHLRIRPQNLSHLPVLSTPRPTSSSGFPRSPNLDQRLAKPRPSERPRAPPVARHPRHPIVPRPHRGSCQNEDGFLSCERHVGVRLHQGLHSRQRQPRETSPGRTRRGMGLRSRCVPTGALLLLESPVSSRHSRHPRPEPAARAAADCVHASGAGPLLARAGSHAPYGRVTPPLTRRGARLFAARSASGGLVACLAVTDDSDAPSCLVEPSFEKFDCKSKHSSNRNIYRRNLNKFTCYWKRQ